MTKEERISEELKRNSRFFETVDGNQKAIVAPLLQNAAFMKVTLEDLQEIINREGVTDKYQNGNNQFGVKQSATLQSYNSLIKNYASVIKTLSQLLPPEEKEQAAAFMWEEQTPEEIRAAKAAEEEREKERQREFELAAAYQKEAREREQQGLKYISYSEFISKNNG